MGLIPAPLPLEMTSLRRFVFFGGGKLDKPSCQLTHPGSAATTATMTYQQASCRIAQGGKDGTADTRISQIITRNTTPTNSKTSQAQIMKQLAQHVNIPSTTARAARANQVEAPRRFAPRVQTQASQLFSQPQRKAAKHL